MYPGVSVDCSFECSLGELKSGDLFILKLAKLAGGLRLFHLHFQFATFSGAGCWWMQFCICNKGMLKARQSIPEAFPGRAFIVFLGFKVWGFKFRGEVLYKIIR